MSISQMNPGQLSKNILSSWATFLVRFVINLFFIPFITATLGEDRYGIWVICFQVISYFSLFEFGFDRALLRSISGFLGKRDLPSINRVLNTATAFYFVAGALVILLTQILAEPIFEQFNTAIPSLHLEGINALKIIGIYLGLRFLLSPLGGNLGSFQRFDLSNLLQGIEDIFRTLLMVWVLYRGGGLEQLAIVILATTSARLLAGSILLKKLYPEISLSPKLVEKKTAGSLISYGSASVAITLASILIFSSEGPLLGIMLSTAAAGLYAPAAQLMLYTRHIINTVGTPLIAALSQLDSEGEEQRVKLLYLHTLKLASIVSFLIAGGVVVLSPDFVALWLKPQFAVSARIMQVLAIGSAVFVPQIIGNALLYAVGRHRYLLLVLAIEAVLKITLALFLVNKFGLIGMAWASALPQIILYSTLYPYLISKVLSLKYSQILKTTLWPGLLAGLLTALISLSIKHFLTIDSWIVFAATVTIATSTTGFAAYCLLEYSEKSAIKKWLGIN